MTAVSAPRPGWELLAGQVNQRRYEALRAYLYEGASLQQAADRADYTRAALASLVRDLRAGKLTMFAPPGVPGRKSAPKKDAARARVIELRREGQRAMGVEVSHDTISKITDEVLEELKAWQVCPLEALYPVVYVDALVAKVRDGDSVRNKALNTAVGIDCEGIKHALGIWVAPAEGRRPGPRRSRSCATGAWKT